MKTQRLSRSHWLPLAPFIFYGCGSAGPAPGPDPAHVTHPVGAYVPSSPDTVESLPAQCTQPQPSGAGGCVIASPSTSGVGGVIYYTVDAPLNITAANGTVDWSLSYPEVGQGTIGVGPGGPTPGQPGAYLCWPTRKVGTMLTESNTPSYATLEVGADLNWHVMAKMYGSDALDFEVECPSGWTQGTGSPLVRNWQEVNIPTTAGQPANSYAFGNYRLEYDFPIILGTTSFIGELVGGGVLLSGELDAHGVHDPLFSVPNLAASGVVAADVLTLTAGDNPCWSGKVVGGCPTESPTAPQYVGAKYGGVTSAVVAINTNTRRTVCGIWEDDGPYDNSGFEFVRGDDNTITLVSVNGWSGAGGCAQR